MFTDLVGSTEMTARLGDARALEIVRAHDALVRRGLAQHDGREVEHMGDGIMASFASVRVAINCAAAVQRSFADWCTRGDGGQPGRLAWVFHFRVRDGRIAENLWLRNERAYERSLEIVRPAK